MRTVNVKRAYHLLLLFQCAVYCNFTVITHQKRLDGAEDDLKKKKKLHITLLKHEPTCVKCVKSTLYAIYFHG